jgi:hypothetical protein
MNVVRRENGLSEKDLEQLEHIAGGYRSRRRFQTDLTLGLGWELNLVAAEVSRAFKRAESAFRENPEIKQILYCD